MPKLNKNYYYQTQLANQGVPPSFDGPGNYRLSLHNHQFGTYNSNWKSFLDEKRDSDRHLLSRFTNAELKASRFSIMVVQKAMETKFCGQIRDIVLPIEVSCVSLSPTQGLGSFSSNGPTRVYTTYPYPKLAVGLVSRMGQEAKLQHRLPVPDQATVPKPYTDDYKQIVADLQQMVQQSDLTDKHGTPIVFVFDSSVGKQYKVADDALSYLMDKADDKSALDYRLVDMDLLEERLAPGLQIAPQHVYKEDAMIDEHPSHMPANHVTVDGLLFCKYHQQKFVPERTVAGQEPGAEHFIALDYCTQALAICRCYRLFVGMNGAELPSGIWEEAGSSTADGQLCLNPRGRALYRLGDGKQTVSPGVVKQKMNKMFGRSQPAFSVVSTASDQSPGSNAESSQQGAAAAEPVAVATGVTSSACGMGARGRGRGRALAACYNDKPSAPGGSGSSPPLSSDAVGGGTATAAEQRPSAQQKAATSRNRRRRVPLPSNYTAPFPLASALSEYLATTATATQQPTAVPNEESVGIAEAAAAPLPATAKPKAGFGALNRPKSKAKAACRQPLGGNGGHSSVVASAGGSRGFGFGEPVQNQHRNQDQQHSVAVSAEGQRNAAPFNAAQTTTARGFGQPVHPHNRQYSAATLAEGQRDAEPFGSTAQLRQPLSSRGFGGPEPVHSHAPQHQSSAPRGFHFGEPVQHDSNHQHWSGWLAQAEGQSSAPPANTPQQQQSSAPRGFGFGEPGPSHSQQHSAELSAEGQTDDRPFTMTQLPRTLLSPGSGSASAVDNRDAMDVLSLVSASHRQVLRQLSTAQRSMRLGRGTPTRPRHTPDHF